MKARLLRSAAELRGGMVLARGIGALRKGAVLTAETIAELPPFDELSVVEMEAGDIHEHPAGKRLAAAAAGGGIGVGGFEEGSWRMTASARGIVEVDAARLAALNDSDDLAVVTLPDGQIVVQEEIVARAKIVPFVIREEELRRAEQAGPAVRVRPFVPMRVAALVQEKLDDESLQGFRAALGAKVRFFGSELASVERAGDIAAALKGCIGRGAQVVALVGSRLMDPLDPVMCALREAGARVEKHGVPVNPGTLLWVATLGDAQIIAAPGCAMLSRPTAFDVLLARLLTGEKLSRRVLARLGAGGLLTKETAFLLPPYRPGAPRGEP